MTKVLHPYAATSNKTPVCTQQYLTKRNVRDKMLWNKLTKSHEGPTVLLMLRKRESCWWDTNLYFNFNSKNV